MLKNGKQVRGIDIRDIACDGYGLTAETSGINRYMSKYLEKLKVESDSVKNLSQNHLLPLNG